MISQEKSLAAYQQLRALIKDKILANEYIDKIPSELELARQHNLNIKTVNKAVASLISEGLLFRVKGTGTFIRKNDLSKSFIATPKNIGVAIYQLRFMNNPFYSHVFGGIGEVIELCGYNLQIITTNKTRKNLNGKSLFYLDVVERGDVNGLIVSGDEVQKEDILKLHKNKFPFVLFGTKMPGKRFNCVDIDNFSGAYKAAAYLISLNHKRIAFMKGFDLKLDNERLAGYKAALQENNIRIDPDYITIGDFDTEKAYKATKKLLSLPARPTALITSDDVMAVAAIQAAQDSGLRVPDDISIIGFNDMQLASALNPPLTTMKIDIHGMGKAAMTLLIEKLKNPDMAPREIIFQPELLVRASTQQFWE